MRIRAYFEYQVLPYFKIAAQAAHSTPNFYLLPLTSYLLTDFQVLSIMRMAAKSCSKLQRDVSSPRRQAKKLVSSST